MYLERCENLSIPMIVALSVWGVIAFCLILADFWVYFDPDGEEMSFIEFRGKKEYRVFDFILLIIFMPAWIVEGAIYLVCYSMYRILTFTVVKRKA